MSSFSMLMCALTLLVLATGTRAQTDDKIVNQEFEINEDGSYISGYETSNGIQSQEEGTSFPGNEPETGNYVRKGSYSYEWEGVTYTVTWEADENGFYAEGDHLPK